MRRVIVLTTLGVLALISAALAEGPKLANQKLILADDGKGRLAKSLHLARLSPDGRHLVCVRVKSVELPPRPAVGARKQRFYHLILRDLKSDMDKPLPTPACMDAGVAAYTLSANIFDSAGGKIALRTSVAVNDNDPHGYRTEKVQAVVYDIASGKLTRLPIIDMAVVPSFDRTGKGLITMTAGGRHEKDGKMLTTPLDKPKLRQLGKWGLPRGVCPAVDVLAMQLPTEGGGKRRGKFILYDLKGDKQIAELPAHEDGAYRDRYCPQWTSDGRYLYYLDVKYEERRGRRKRRPITRIWDRTKGQEAGIVGDVVPVGPGPGESTMVVAKDFARGQMSLHDAATGGWHPLGKETMNAIAAEGKYLLYADNPPHRKSGIYMAEIVLAKKEKPAKTPPAKKEPETKPRAVK